MSPSVMSLTCLRATCFFFFLKIKCYLLLSNYSNCVISDISLSFMSLDGGTLRPSNSRICLSLSIYSNIQSPFIMSKHIQRGRHMGWCGFLWM